jgi:predicted AlkP superfamily pyrophosphatase or phosphodiesterase
MHKTVVINVVGLTTDLLSPETSPNLWALAKDGAQRPIETILPAVTCSVQSTFLTGVLPREHGIVGNGWYFRDLAEVLFWRQSNHLVTAEKVWETAKRRDASFTCAQMFWWFNMHSSADVAVTPRPLYPSDGRKIPDIYTEPKELRDELNERLGQFPLFHFWGPKADIISTDWIASSALDVFDRKKPTLSLIYLPHLDYNLQRLGPDDPAIKDDVRAVDAVVGRIADHVRAQGARVVVLSEYGITKVTGAIHVNRALRDAKLLRIREELGTEKLDAGGSEAFAVVDHQIAHVYVKKKERIPEVKKLLASLDGVERVLEGDDKREAGLDHARSGELIAIAKADRWFTYYFWNDDALAPDYARTVDIHRKPGYDPVELFVDPKIPLVPLKVGFRLAQKMLGFRYLMDVIPLDASLVKGSHGRLTERREAGPVLISTEGGFVPDQLHACDVKALLLRHLFDDV